jgi:predicted dehydrogenase
MAASMHDAQRMVELADLRKLKLSVFHNRRWDDDFMTLRRLLTAGKLGEWAHFESRFDRFRPTVVDRWREHPVAGAGIWWDLGPHLVDQALVLFGRPDALQADLATQRAAAQVADYANVTLYYGQRRAVLRATMLDANTAFRLRVQGERGVFVTRGQDPQEAALGGTPPATVAPRFAELTLVNGGEVVTAQEPLGTGDYGAFYRGICDALESGAELPVSATAGLAVMEVLEAAVASAQLGCVISL